MLSPLQSNNPVTNLEKEEARTNWPLLFSLVETAPLSSFLEGAIRRAIINYPSFEHAVPHFHQEIVSSLLGDRDLFKSKVPDSPTLDLIYITVNAYPDLLLDLVPLNKKEIRVLHKFEDQLNLRIYNELSTIAENLDENIDHPKLLETFVRAAKQVRTALEITAISTPSPALIQFHEKLRSLHLLNNPMMLDYQRDEVRTAMRVLHQCFVSHLRAEHKGRLSPLPEDALIERVWLSPELFHKTNSQLLPPFGKLMESGMDGNPAFRTAEMQTTLDFAMIHFLENYFEKQIPISIRDLIVATRISAQKSFVMNQRLSLAISGASEAILSWVGKWW